MMTFLTRRKLLTDTSSMEIARVTDILKQNNIKYELITKKDQSTFGSIVHTSMGASVGNGGAFSHSQSNGITNFVYHIYVSLRDLSKAEDLIK